MVKVDIPVSIVNFHIIDTTFPFFYFFEKYE